MTDESTIIMLDPSMRARVMKATAVGRDGMRFYCEDPLLGKWRAESWIDGMFSVGFGHDMASARADLISQRERLVMA